MSKTNAHARKRKKKPFIPLLAFLMLAFAGGYFNGRVSSTNWNSEKTALMYMYRASHRLSNSPDGALLELPLPDAVYRYNGKDVAIIPNAAYLAAAPFPVLGAEEYENSLKVVVALGAGAAAKPMWDAVTDSTTVQVVRGLTAEERAVASILT